MIKYKETQLQVPQCKERAFIGIDPSTKTGIVAVGLDGMVLASANLHQRADRTRQKVKQKRNPYDRLRAFEMALEDFLEKFIIEAVFIEKYAFNLHGKFKQSPDSIITQCRYGEAIRASLYRYGHIGMEVTPSQLKKYALGVGQGAKDEIRLGIYKQWGVEFKTDDECDAFVLARMACDWGSTPEPTTKEKQTLLAKIYDADYNVALRESRYWD